MLSFTAGPAALGGGLPRGCAKKVVKVLNQLRGKRRALDTAQRGQRLEDVGDKGGLVALAAMRNRRKVRAVGFDQEPIGRDWRAPRS